MSNNRIGIRYFALTKSEAVSMELQFQCFIKFNVEFSAHHDEKIPRRPSYYVPFRTKMGHDSTIAIISNAIKID